MIKILSVVWARYEHSMSAVLRFERSMSIEHGMSARIQKTQQTGRRLRGNFGQMWKFGWKNVEIWVEIFE